MYLIKRNNIYHIVFYDEYGRQQSKSTKCKTKAAANEFAVKYFEELKERKQKKVTITYKEFHDFYSDYASARFTTSYQEFVGYAFSQFQRVIDKKLQLKDIAELDIEKFVQLKLSEAGVRIINDYLRTLQVAFQRAVDLGYLQKNVFKNVKKLKTEENL